MWLEFGEYSPNSDQLLGVDQPLFPAGSGMDWARGFGTAIKKVSRRVTATGGTRKRRRQGNKRYPVVQQDESQSLYIIASRSLVKRKDAPRTMDEHGRCQEAGAPPDFAAALSARHQLPVS